MNLSAYKKVGPFNEDLFIDYVDFEYCLRLRKKGFKVLQLGVAKIYHQLGQLEKRNFIFKTIYVTHHSSIRYYYRTRNRLFVTKKFILSFPLFVLKDFFIFINELVKIVLFEKNKMSKLKILTYGVSDFLLGRYGKFEDIHSEYSIQ